MKRLQRRSLATFWTVLLFFYVPIVVLVVNSFNASRFSGAWKGFTFKWYRLLFNDREIWHALGNTMQVAVGATFAAVVLGTLAALALSKWKGRIQSAHYGLLYTHLVLPDILMGISLLLFFISIGLKQGLFTVFLAHTTFCVSYVAMAVLGRLEDFDNNLLEAARDLGANPWQTFWKVQFPLLLPGIVAGGLLSFTLSIDDFVITFFVSGLTVLAATGSGAAAGAETGGIAAARSAAETSGTAIAGAAPAAELAPVCPPPPVILLIAACNSS